MIKAKFEHMKDKILALLVAKFAGVRKDGLAQLAASLSLQIEKEEEATALVEKISLEKVNDFVKDWRSIVDKEVSDGTKTHELNLKKKYDLIEKKEQDPGKDLKPGDPNDIAALVLQAVNAAVAPLQQKLSAFEGQKVSETRLQQIEAKFKGLPESNKSKLYKEQRLADAKLLINTTDDAAFEEYSTRLDTDIAAFSQELANDGLGAQHRPIFGNKNADGVSTATQAFIASKTEQSKPLAGKEI